MSTNNLTNTRASAKRRRDEGEQGTASRRSTRQASTRPPPPPPPPTTTPPSPPATPDTDLHPVIDMDTREGASRVAGQTGTGTGPSPGSHFAPAGPLSGHRARAAHNVTAPASPSATDSSSSIDDSDASGANSSRAEPAQEADGTTDLIHIKTEDDDGAVAAAIRKSASMPCLPMDFSDAGAERKLKIAQPAPLRTSCEACRLARRGCDGDSPCSRCVQKGIDCCRSIRKKAGQKGSWEISREEYLERQRKASISVIGRRASSGSPPMGSSNSSSSSSSASSNLAAKTNNVKPAKRRNMTAPSSSSAAATKSSNNNTAKATSSPTMPPSITTALPAGYMMDSPHETNIMSPFSAYPTPALTMTPTMGHPSSGSPTASPGNLYPMNPLFGWPMSTPSSPNPTPPTTTENGSGGGDQQQPIPENYRPALPALPPFSALQSNLPAMPSPEFVAGYEAAAAASLVAAASLFYPQQTGADGFQHGWPAAGINPYFPSYPIPPFYPQQKDALTAPEISAATRHGSEDPMLSASSADLRMGMIMSGEHSGEGGEVEGGEGMVEMDMIAVLNDEYTLI